MDSVKKRLRQSSTKDNLTLDIVEEKELTNLGYKIINNIILSDDDKAYRKFIKVLNINGQSLLVEVDNIGKGIELIRENVRIIPYEKIVNIYAHDYPNNSFLYCEDIICYIQMDIQTNQPIYETFTMKNKTNSLIHSHIALPIVKYKEIIENNEKVLNYTNEIFIKSLRNSYLETEKLLSLLDNNFEILHENLKNLLNNIDTLKDKIINQNYESSIEETIETVEFIDFKYKLYYVLMNKVYELNNEIKKLNDGRLKLMEN